MSGEHVNRFIVDVDTDSDFPIKEVAENLADTIRGSIERLGSGVVRVVIQDEQETPLEVVEVEDWTS